MLGSGDGRTRDLIATIEGAGWDFNMSRHPYHHVEAPLKPRYTVYNRRFMCCSFDETSTIDGYWQLRRSVGVLHTGELPIDFRGPDAERLLNKLFIKDISKVRPGRCGYGVACYHDGTLIVDGVLLRLEADRFWYAQADGDFYSWARAHAVGLDVEVFDPKVYVSQVQGPDALRVLEAVAGGLPEPFGYFGIATVDLGGNQVFVSRTGYTNELGWEFYTEPSHDADAIWEAITLAGEPYGLEMIGLDSMHIRRIEAGILNANSDFDHTMTPYEAGLGRFADLDAGDFIGRDALLDAPRGARLIGLLAEAEPKIGGDVRSNGERVGVVTAGAMSPYLGSGVGICRMDAAGLAVEVDCVDGQSCSGTTAMLPLYDEAAAIPRGKLVAIPEIPATSGTGAARS